MSARPRPRDTALARVFQLMTRREILRRRLAGIDRQIDALRRKHGLTPWPPKP